MLVEIDERYCIGCGRCVDDCVGANLEVEGVTARVKGLCILCGHCVAVCPTGAVSIPSYDMADVETCVPAGAAVDPRTMLRVVKSRRSVRDYLPNTIEQDTLRLVLEAGRYTATAKNAQGCRFIVVQDELDEFKRRSKAVMDKCYAKCIEFGGQVSGEHAIGHAKKQYLVESAGETVFGLMQAIKQVFDPKGILNPGKVCTNVEEG